MSNQKFKLEPEQCSPKISVKRYGSSSKKVEFHCKMCNSTTKLAVKESIKHIPSLHDPT
jgi:hypothetical protein